jgi:hypothetical protein
MLRRREFEPKVSSALVNRIAQIQTVLTVVAILALLTWGIYAVLWQFPNDQGSILQAVFNAENPSGDLGPKGNGTIITPGSEARYIIMYTGNPKPGFSAGTYSEPQGLGFDFGPFAWNMPSSSLTNHDVNYAVFSFLFGTQSGKPSPLWFTGPQGNLSYSYITGIGGGLDDFLPKLSGSTVSGRAVLEASGPGNYTLHYLNTGTANENGWVEMGPSTVNYSRPYFVPAAITIGLGTGLAVFTALVPWRKSRKSTETGTPA